MSRSTRLDLEPLIGALRDIGGATGADPTTDRILDATLATLAAGGLRRCTVEEIAERADIGRSTIYRRFGGRDELIHALVARELRRVLDAIADSVEHIDNVTDKVVEGFLSGLQAAEGSAFLDFVRSEPDLLLFLAKDSYPVTELVTALMVNELLKSVDPTEVRQDDIDLDQARHVAEVVFRLAISFISLPGSTLPLDDSEAARLALHSIFDPLIEATI